MDIFFYISLSITLILSLLLVFPALTTLSAALFRVEEVKDSAMEVDFACIITVYQNFDICTTLIDSLQKQKYQRFHIYIVADDCEAVNMPDIPTNVSLLVPAHKLASKVKSMKYALANFIRSHDATVIFDPDNLAHPAFLSEIKPFFGADFSVVQGKRTAKNLDTPIAAIDGMGEAYYNYTVRQTPFRLGSSSTIAGSGMVIETGLFRAYLTLESMDTGQHKVIIAEDNILQNYAVALGKRIAYAPAAIVYDEKVDSPHQIRRQRTRWLKSYFQHVRQSATLFVQGVKQSDFNIAFFGLLTSYPPLSILVSAVLVFGMIYIFLFPMLVLWLAFAFLLFILHFFVVLYLSNAPSAIWKVIWMLPYFLLLQLSALLHLSATKTDFLVTDHKRKITIDDLLDEKAKKR